MDSVTLEPPLRARARSTGLARLSFAFAALVLTPIAMIIGYAFASLLWVAIVSAAAWVLAGVTARSALGGDQAAWRMPEQPAEPPATRPYLIMNPG